MTPEAKLRALEAIALARLSRPLEGAEPAGIDRPTVVLRLWSHPSFEAYRSWSLVGSRATSDGPWLVRKVTWERPIDCQRALHPLKQAAFMIDRDPRPTIQVQDVRLHDERAGELLARLEQLALPPLLALEGIHLDGVRHGLETQQGRVRLEWHDEGPRSWWDFTQALERLCLDLEAEIDRS